MGKKLELAVAILNGAVGDHLARTGNGLATEMTCIAGGRPLAMEREAIASAYPNATPRVAILLHGLMCTEDIWTHADGADYGSLLARDHGFTPLYLRYNSGRPIFENGAAFAALLDQLVAAYPVPIEEIVPIGYSMGGLVVRSACHVASTAKDGPSAWLPRVRRVMYVGTPHQGAPMERVGRFVSKILRAVDDPYTQLAAELADLRSGGVKDLGDADLRDEDRAVRRQHVGLRDPRHPVPLLPEIQHYLVAGSLSTDIRLASLFGDSIVPVASATDGGCVDAATFALPPSHVKIVSGASHMRIAHDPEVYEHLRACGRRAPRAEIQHYLVAGSLSTDIRLASLFGDSIVPVASATDGGCVDAATFALPPSHVKIVSGASHMRIAHDPEVYEHLRAWCAPPASEGESI